MGATHIAQVLVELAVALGWRTVVVDPRSVFATPARFPRAGQVVVDWPQRARQVLRARSPRMRGFSGTYDVCMRGSNPLCGDDIGVRLAFGTRDGGARVIERAAFEGYACSLCTASADALLEYTLGRTVDSLFLLVPDDLERLLGGIAVRLARRRCLTLPLETLRECLSRA